ncbi:hypothetical protein GPECTOR_5g186 [Gonium pectorale]|uniref:cellulase n=1 Tax=Gonium pectorale TaxID=33097 RepID=A0A150GXI3_GONPE|nr:hypothetical protein GPECTOR_5g186 [Gonium pectorale]|eukprot:KXZ54080.1 hypothetical protein GPECTOR_5g186 [Gonium pectorale]
MSGELPDWSFARAWRRGSHLGDKLHDTAPITGGWNTDGGHLKSSLTIASSASLMAFAALTWEDTLRAGPDGKPDDATWNQLLRNLEWAADYLHQCATAGGSGVFVAQVGDHFTEDSYWGAPEDQPDDRFRPVWVVRAGYREGADVTSQRSGEATDTGPGSPSARGQRFIDKADELWSWAKSLDAVWQAPEGNNTILSRTHSDDQAWAAAWICKRELLTSGADVESACTEAADLWDDYHMREGLLNTDNWHAAALLLLRDTGAGGSEAAAKYLAALKARYLNPWVPSDLEAPSAKPASAMAFVSLAAAAEPAAGSTVDPREGRRWQCWAKRQVDWMLGNNPSSKALVTGLEGTPGFSGIAIPTQPRHRGSACTNGVCAAPGQPNLRTLPGALLAGPHRDGTIEDNRDNGPYAFVSIEYNGALAAALMGLVALRSDWTASGRSWSAFCSVCPDVAGFTATVDLAVSKGLEIRDYGSAESAVGACSYLPWCTYVSGSGGVWRSGDIASEPGTCLYTRHPSVHELADSAQVMIGTSLGASASCWDAGSSLADGNEVVQYQCDNVENQKFYLIQADDAWWKLIASSGLCLGFKDAGVVNQTPMILKTCAEAEDQLFTFTAKASGGYTIRPQHAPGIIGANTRLLRCLPHLLQQLQRSAIVAFLDFAKAYDTSDRSFLLAAMDRMGFGSGFLAWAQLVLSDTCAVASVNGYLSQALKEHGVGAALGCAASAARATASQFADDTQVALNSAGEVPGFRELMVVFARSGLWPAPQPYEGRAAAAVVAFPHIEVLHPQGLILR